METVFEKFGGIRPMADHLSESPSTVQGWKTAGRIPAGKQPGVLSKAAELGLDVEAVDVVFPLGHDEMDSSVAAPAASGKITEVSGAQVRA